MTYKEQESKVIAHNEPAAKGKAHPDVRNTENPKAEKRGNY